MFDDFDFLELVAVGKEKRSGLREAEEVIGGEERVEDAITTLVRGQKVCDTTTPIVEEDVLRGHGSSSGSGGRMGRGGEG